MGPPPALVPLTPPLVNLSSLIDDAKCYELVRQHRWPDGVRCPHCESAAVAAREPREPRGAAPGAPHRPHLVDLQHRLRGRRRPGPPPLGHDPAPLRRWRPPGAAVPGPPRPPPRPGRPRLAAGRRPGPRRRAALRPHGLLGLRAGPLAHATVFPPACVMVTGLALSAFLLGERPGRSQLAGCALLSLGLLALAYDGLAGGGRLTWLGDLLFALAGCSWGVFTFLLRRWRVAPVRAVAAVTIPSALAIVPAWLLITGGVPPPV